MAEGAENVTPLGLDSESLSKSILGSLLFFALLTIHISIQTIRFAQVSYIQLRHISGNWY